MNGKKRLSLLSLCSIILCVTLYPMTPPDDFSVSDDYLANSPLSDGRNDGRNTPDTPDFSVGSGAGVRPYQRSTESNPCPFNSTRYLNALHDLDDFSKEKITVIRSLVEQVRVLGVLDADVRRIFNMLYPQPLVSYQDFKTLIDQELERREQQLLERERWHNNKIIFDRTDYNGYIEKRSIAQGTKLICIGDLHGNSKGFVEIIRWLQDHDYLDHQLMLSADCMLVFLGDLVDYGVCGSDTLFLTLLLSAKNPEQVIICRGNHEEHQVFSKDFSREVQSRYQLDTHVIQGFNEDAANLFKTFPYAVFLETDQRNGGYAMCCHGAFEEGAFTIVKDLLEGDASFAVLDTSQAWSNTGMCGFNWNDVSGKKTLSVEERYPRTLGNRADEHCKVQTLDELQAIFEKLSIRLLLRGHQDFCDPIKFSIPGIHYPLWPLMIRNNDLKKVTYHETDIAILERFGGDVVYDLFKNYRPFAIRDFKQSFGTDVFVTTCSNAGGIKGLTEHGCGVLTVGESWDNSMFQPIIITTDATSRSLPDIVTYSLNHPPQLKPIWRRR